MRLCIPCPGKRPPRRQGRTGSLLVSGLSKGMGEFELTESRTLSLYAQQCVAMELADGRVPNADKLMGESKLPVAVLATPDGTPVNKVENTDGKLKVARSRKSRSTAEMKQRETAVDWQIKEAADKVKAGDNDGAITLYQAVAGAEMSVPEEGKRSREGTEETRRTTLPAYRRRPIFEPSSKRDDRTHDARGLDCRK